ncbi:hypothetical protein SAMN02745945_02998 [Peptoclostridium litorale DSM 5388]|uniref:Uncharacterized protein n=1 Tax=Peptoclostridium litorale DSM 5388 TaxID=1121324 RepID=A0A069RC39_PEPLI|nr:hypothetical protein [Peptoclostridium litorale]KDR94353.1 hypothetical protein CLIT_21c00030 [Peptoclostridium litorale DSM 5388]SIO37394.1 hypothetical protein SAMN02745945_02998 [Peptoclostridium litorale DSM 5388]
MEKTFEKNYKNENNDVFSPSVDFSSLKSEKSDELRREVSQMNFNYFGLGNLELL